MFSVAHSVLACYFYLTDFLKCRFMRIIISPVLRSAITVRCKCYLIAFVDYIGIIAVSETMKGGVSPWQLQTAFARHRSSEWIVESAIYTEDFY